jgi:hypothetical protein
VSSYERCLGSGIDGGKVLHKYLSVQKTRAKVKVNAMRGVSFLKRDTAIGGKHAGRSLQIQVFNQPAAQENRAQTAMKSIATISLSPTADLTATLQRAGLPAAGRPAASAVDPDNGNDQRGRRGHGDARAQLPADS